MINPQTNEATQSPTIVKATATADSPKIGALDLPLLKVKEDEQAQKQAPLGPYDILCGRGKVSFNNIGNRRFRVTISLNLDAYMKVKSRNQKAEFIAFLVNHLKSEVGVRFVARQKDGSLKELNSRQERQKVGHALRDLAVAKEQSIAAEDVAKAAARPNKKKRRIDEGIRTRSTIATTATTTNTTAATAAAAATTGNRSDSDDSEYDSDSWASSFFPTEEHVDVLDDHSCM